MLRYGCISGHDASGTNFRVYMVDERWDRITSSGIYFPLISGRLILVERGVVLCGWYNVMY